MQLRLIAAAVSAALTGCGFSSFDEPQAASHDQLYDLPVAEAYRRLAYNDLDELRFRRQCGILIHIRPRGDPRRNSVTWRVYSSGREMVHFTARLTPVEGNRTRVAVEMKREVRNGGEAYDGFQFYPRPAFNQPLRPAVEEQIAALLEGRAFDISRVPRGRDGVCGIQRAGLEAGHRPLKVEARLGPASRTTAEEYRERVAAAGR
jgi:hypothetical protein